MTGDRGGPTKVWRSAAAVLGIVVVMALMTPLVRLVFPRTSKSCPPPSCTSNLAQLGGLFVANVADRPWHPRSGPALFLEWRKTRSHIRPGEESVLICPNDDSIDSPDTPESRARYDTVDLDHPPADLCSYAVRDFERFPLDPAAKEPQLLAACVGREPNGPYVGRHKRGVSVLFTNGNARFLTFEELGLTPGVVPTVGPKSNVPMLRALRFGEPAPR